MISSNVHLFLPHLCPGAPICLRRIASGYCRKSFFVPRVCVSLLPETNRYVKSAAMNDSYLSDRCTSSRSIATEHSGLLPLLIIQLPIQSNRTILKFRFCAPKLLPVPPFPSRLFAKTSRNQSASYDKFSGHPLSSLCPEATPRDHEIRSTSSHTCRHRDKPMSSGNQSRGSVRAKLLQIFQPNRAKANHLMNNANIYAPGLRTRSIRSEMVSKTTEQVHVL